MRYGNFRIPYGLRNAVGGLLAANIAVFIIEVFSGTKFLEIFGLIPARVTGSLWLWQLVTYMFLHGGIFHISINLFVLWMFGRIIEGRWGSREFLRYYFICGLGASVLTILLGPFSESISIGASGAVYGLLLAFAVLYPDEYLYLYFVVPVKAKYFVIFLGGMAFFGSLSSSNTGIAHIAHLGGLLTGYAYLRYPSVKRGILTRLSRIGERRHQGSEVPYAAGERVNEILDKIISRGVESLTPEEKEIMRKYSEDKKTGYMN
jgi:membrane associated rhomboid family serine protease